MCDRLRSAAQIADDYADATDQLADIIGLNTDELDAFADTLRQHQRRTARIPEMAIQHGAQALYTPHDKHPRELATHMAACLATTEAVLYAITEAGYRIVRTEAADV